MATLTSSSINNIGDGHPNDGPNVNPASQNSNGTIGYHGNCAQCHHLHTNKAVVLPTDHRKHERICCDACGYYMGGLGGNSTQSSLASVETILDMNGVGSTSAARPLTLPCSNASSPSTSGADTAPVNDPSNTNAEGDSRGGRPVGPSPQPTPDVNTDERVTSVRETTDASSAAAAQVPGLENNGSPLQVSGHLRKGRRARVKEKLGFGRLSERKERRYGFRILGFQVNILRESTEDAPSNSGPIQTHPSQDNESHLPVSTARSNSHDLQRNEVIPYHRVRHLVEVLKEEPSRAARLERIRIIRREKTKQRQAHQGLTCKCDESCRCMSGSQGSNDTSAHRRVSIPDSYIPVHALHDPIHPSEQSRPSHENITQSPMGIPNHVTLRGLGSHFDAMGVQSGTDSSGSAGRRRSRTSEATTAVGSAGSGSSLLDPGPSLRRSNSMPLPMAHQPASQYRPEVRDALHNIHMLEATIYPYGVTHLEPLPENHHGEQSQASGDSGSTDETAHTDAEPTSLANMPGPDAAQDGSPTPSARDQRLIRTPQGGSEDPTPRARSQHDADDGSSITLEPGPDEVSVMLNEVTERTSEEQSVSTSEE